MEYYAVIKKKIFCVVLGIEHRDLYMLGKCSTIKLHPYPTTNMQQMGLKKGITFSDLKVNLKNVISIYVTFLK
jgi:hypothetical protein